MHELQPRELSFSQRQPRRVPKTKGLHTNVGSVALLMLARIATLAAALGSNRRSASVIDRSRSTFLPLCTVSRSPRRNCSLPDLATIAQSSRTSMHACCSITGEDSLPSLWTGRPTPIFKKSVPKGWLRVRQLRHCKRTTN